MTDKQSTFDIMRLLRYKIKYIKHLDGGCYVSTESFYIQVSLNRGRDWLMNHWMKYIVLWDHMQWTHLHYTRHISANLCIWPSIFLLPFAIICEVLPWSTVETYNSNVMPKREVYIQCVCLHTVFCHFKLTNMPASLHMGLTILRRL